MKQLHFTSKFTTRDSIALEKYFNEISKKHLISPEEEIEIMRKYREDGDIKTLEKLVVSNLRFVVSVAKQYEGMGLSFEDLISEGNIGLMKAAKRFDETKGYKFISYAIYWIRQTILKALNENSRLIRLPYNQIAQIQKLHNAFLELEQHVDYTPTDEEVSKHLGIEASEVRSSLSISNKPTSLDAPVGDDEAGGSVWHVIKNDTFSDPDDALMSDSVQFEVKQLIGKLTQREAMVIKMNFGLDGDDPKELKDIAEIMGLGRERVRQIKVKALLRLRKLGGDNIARLAA